MIINVGKIISYEQEIRKARLISIKDNKILVCNYNDFLMLPGGKVDKNESPEDALKRELKEELGANINDFCEFLTINNYAENYPSRTSNKPVNRKCKTTYFITNQNVKLKKDEANLSEKEKEGIFTTEYVDIDKLVSSIDLESLDYKKRIYAEELLRVINFYLKKDKLIDLHVHTNSSDGEHSPQETVNKAIEEGLNVVAITDHDTIKGINEIDLNDERIIIIPGIEISVKIKKGRMHILGLGINHQDENLVNFLKEMKEFNRHNVRNIINYLQENGIHFNEDDIENLMHLEKNVGRPDVAKLLIKEGYVTGIQEAFDKYLIEAFIKSRHLNKGHNYKEVIEVINNANGIPILAHPNSLELNHHNFEILIKDMVANNLKGLEIFHPHMSEEEREYYYGIAEYYNLFISGGTDYHGEHIKPNIKLGTGINNVYITDLPLLKELTKRKSNK